MPFFTSEASRQRTIAALFSTETIINLSHRGRDFLERNRGSRLILNPHGPNTVIFNPTQIESLLGDQRLVDEPGLSRVGVSEPGIMTKKVDVSGLKMETADAVVPPELTETLVRFFAQRPGIEAAHLGWYTLPSGASGYLVVVVASDEDDVAGWGALELEKHLRGTTLSLMVERPGRDHALMTCGAVDGPSPRRIPFYERDTKPAGRRSRLGLRRGRHA